MIGEPLPQISDNMIVLRPDIGGVGNYFVHLGEALTTSVLEVEFNVFKGLIDFVTKIGYDKIVEVNIFVFSDPASCVERSKMC
jgi:hypothetical protein